jgi:hypothetical protein
MGRPTDEQAQRFAHRSEVGPEIDDIGNQKHSDDPPQQPCWIVGADIAGDPLAGYPADARADLLNRGHQRIAEQHDPGHTVAKLGADLRIGRNPARIIVGGASDQTRAEEGEKPPSRRATSAPMTRDPRCERMGGFALRMIEFGNGHGDLFPGGADKV